MDTMRPDDDPFAKRLHHVAVRVELEDRGETRACAVVRPAPLGHPDAHAVLVDLDGARGAPRTSLGQLRPSGDGFVRIREVIGRRHRGASAGLRARAAHQRRSQGDRNHKVASSNHRCFLPVRVVKRYFLNVTLGCAAAREPNARIARSRCDMRRVENSDGGLSIRIFLSPSSSAGNSLAPAGYALSEKMYARTSMYCWRSNEPGLSSGIVVRI